MWYGYFKLAPENFRFEFFVDQNLPIFRNFWTFIVFRILICVQFFFYLGSFGYKYHRYTNVSLEKPQDKNTNTRTEKKEKKIEVHWQYKYVALWVDFSTTYGTLWKKVFDSSLSQNKNKTKQISCVHPFWNS